MRKGMVAADAFSSRLTAVEILLNFPSEAQRGDLNVIAGELDSVSTSFDSSAAAVAYSAFAGLVRIASTLIQWHEAVLGALPEADRFLRSAKARHQLWLQEYVHQEPASELVKAVGELQEISNLGHAAQVINAIGSIPLPVGMIEHARSTYRLPSFATKEEAEPPPPALTVAFLKFQIDSVAAHDVHQLAPGEVHDLEIEVRVSRWPEEHSELELTPISVEPASSYEFPSFRFARPVGDAPYILSKRARAILKASQGLHARPFEFKYSAEFLPSKSEQPVAIVGHRTLLIDGTHPSTPISGYPVMDSRLIEIRESLRKITGITPKELLDLLTVLTALFNLAGRAIQDALFPGKRTEAQFQEDVRSALRLNPAIGVELDEHANAAGGITDLSFRAIPIELKVENASLFSAADGMRFVGQVASYAVAKGKRTAVLCVLDCSNKIDPPRDPAGLVQLVSLENGVQVCILVIEGNLRKPSALSKGRLA